ncbi:hypothetical protein WN943_013742 [Citrus x changshan-huyou]
MAPTLTSSNSFMLNTTPRSRLIIKNPRFSVFAKKGGPFPPFQLGKSKDENSSDESSNGDFGNSNPFRFNFGKVRDVTSLIPVVSSPGIGLSFGTGQADVRILWQRPRRRENGTPKDSRGRDEVAAAAEKLLLEGEKEKALLP